MQYYHDLITQKSWQLLQSLSKKYNFVLIGGWAVFIYAQTLKSKDIDMRLLNNTFLFVILNLIQNLYRFRVEHGMTDGKTLFNSLIDIVLDYQELEKLKEEFPATKNERLKKYEIKTGGIDIDVYLPFYSNLGVPIEEVARETRRTEGFKVPKIELLALLKVKALTERKNSVKGRKDMIDLVSLFALESFSFSEFRELADRYRLNDLVRIVASEIKITSQIEELGLNVHRMAAFKRMVLPQLLTQ